VSFASALRVRWTNVDRACVVIPSLHRGRALRVLRASFGPSCPMALARRTAKARTRYGSLKSEGLVCNIIGYVTQLPDGNYTH
jgi:hypothetical protein